MHGWVHGWEAEGGWEPTAERYRHVECCYNAETIQPKAGVLGDGVCAAVSPGTRAWVLHHPAGLSRRRFCARACVCTCG